MFVCKLRTPSCSHYEHFHVYLAYRSQTGNVVTRQTFDRASRITKSPTAHISRGAYVGVINFVLCTVRKRIRIPYGILIQDGDRSVIRFKLISLIFSSKSAFKLINHVYLNKIELPFIQKHKNMSDFAQIVSK